MEKRLKQTCVIATYTQRDKSLYLKETKHKMAKAKTSHESNVTTDHEEIRNWVEERDGHPAIVKGTEKGGSALLRIDYPGFSGEDRLEEIGWDEFFEIFDENKLAFLHQDQTADGELSRFSKFVERGATKK